MNRWLSGQDSPNGTRPRASTCWPAPEDPTNLNKRQLGNLHLTDAEEDAIVAFMKTLTDGYKPPPKLAAK